MSVYSLYVINKSGGLIYNRVRRQLRAALAEGLSGLSPG
jgi:hypothetical protein